MAPQTPFTPREYPSLPVQETIDALPPPYSGDVLSTIRTRVADPSTPLLVVLDDDPTGTQTCHNIPVLTVWDHATLLQELRSTPGGFFILTNSRALPPLEARKLISTICEAVKQAAKEAGKEFCVVLRGDSTLRGHFPDEPETVEQVLGNVDNWVMVPFFYQGGRYTIDDVHYVAEKGTLVPASQTPFAADATFGYKSSNLRDYVLEKAGDRFSKNDLFSITLEDIRVGGPEKVTQQLLKAPKGGVIVVNAAAESDMFVFAAGALAGEFSVHNHQNPSANATQPSRRDPNYCTAPVPPSFPLDWASRAFHPSPLPTQSYPLRTANQPLAPGASRRIPIPVEGASSSPAPMYQRQRLSSRVSALAVVQTCASSSLMLRG